ncbi:MAG TPA: radical SAM protein [Candidatus Thermoplasmatota archaeon]|jgi:radical SAM superfamily enzyme with C-terminal helix-hairpin-helix motif|nr:radical SAM protein [Candidatus Thermoplasmatota archaeon]
MRRLVILDGYVDEPACFGVPPYLGPHARYIAGAMAEVPGWSVDYLTIDQHRRSPEHRAKLDGADLLVLISGALVPGKYLRGMPVSYREAQAIASSFGGETLLAGSSAVWGFGQGGGKPPLGRHELKGLFTHLAFQDAAAYLHDVLALGQGQQRRMTMDEWGRWSIAGAALARTHPDWPRPLIAEIETYHGCVRYVDGGCAFCMEPAEGQPKFRPVEQVVAEVGALAAHGVVNVRLGGQADFFSYHARGVGEGPEPRPNPGAIEQLLVGIRRVAPTLEWLHIDNVDPGILAAWPAESEAIARLVAEHCTDGNIAAFGVESVDPAVIARNHLKCPPDVALAAIRLLNKVGAARGPMGLPKFLPGLNFIAGLPGETRETYRLNMEFLAQVRDEGLLVRRINLRKLLEQRIAGGADEGLFYKFKDWVRREVDQPMLRRIAPAGTILRSVWMEYAEGSLTFGRQPGSYALLVGVPYALPLERAVDIVVTDHGFRSLTGVQHPFPVNGAPLRALQALPGVGKKRAARLAVARPLASPKELAAALDDPAVAASLAGLLSFAPAAAPTPRAPTPRRARGPRAG